LGVASAGRGRGFWSWLGDWKWSDGSGAVILEGVSRAGIARCKDVYGFGASSIAEVGYIVSPGFEAASLDVSGIEVVAADAHLH
jgi:hypothetical protein